MVPTTRAIGSGGLASPESPDLGAGVHASESSLVRRISDT
jgi:hypothetical protein